MKTTGFLAAMAATMTLAASAHAETGFLKCQGSKGCALVRTEVANSTPVLDGADFVGTPFYGTSFEADYEVDAHFDCPPFKTPSSVDLVASPTSSLRLIIQATPQHATLRGTGPLRLNDTNPADTGRLYDVFLKCNISVNVTSMRPSSIQTARWLQDAAAIVRDIDGDADFYPGRWDVENWYDLYVGDPETGRGILVDLIKTLRASASTADQTQADAFQKILDGFTLDSILAPYLAAKARLEANAAQALLVKKLLVFAQKQNEQNMDAARDRALAALKKP